MSTSPGFTFFLVMKLVIRISTRLSSMAPTPKGFLPIQGLEHLGLVFGQRVFTTPEEFNLAISNISDSRISPNGCKFFAYALTAEDEAKADAATREWTPPDAGTEYTIAVDPAETTESTPSKTFRKAKSNTTDTP